ncbi:hypothetical protein AWRI3578_g2594 [Hanseniaspora opuntiae]|jgi:hypothetical protein|uniref:Uncharacterized protein n=1 Tax=Hanseniaspora opuntiae TaxID=211096 RepID=A0A1E5RCG4_9ASCO|nr:hypothetical protein AWRI3578_g2594 [Hanseniaspora opuntiae]
MLAPEKIKSWVSELFKTKAYYENQIFEDETQFYEYIAEINLDSNNVDDYEYIQKNRDLIFNSLFELKLKKRDEFLVNYQKELSLRNIIRTHLAFLPYFMVTNAFIFFSSASVIYGVFVYSFLEVIYVTLVNVVLYQICFKYLKRKVIKKLYEAYDKDSQEYYQSRGTDVFGSNFLSDYDDSQKGYQIQIFKDKESGVVNSMCVTQPVIESDDKMTIRIGFMGTSTDRKLKINIMNKMISKVCLEQDKLKQDHPGLQVNVEIALRLLDTEMVTFLGRCKDFKFEKYVDGEDKLFKGLSKCLYKRE